MIYWIWLSTLKEIGVIEKNRLLNHFLDPYNVFTATEDEFLKVEGIGKIKAKRIFKSKSLVRANRIIEDLRKMGISVLTKKDDYYPEYARRNLNTPILLYYKGTLRKFSKSISIIGSRRCSKYSKKRVKEISEFFSKNGVMIVSGMAKGIDGYAHTACINSGGYTLAFLGTAINVCYPSEHYSLYRKIISNGAILSEYPPNEKSNPKNFVKRNLLIALWCDKLIVIEANENSGSLTTVNYAKLENIPVYVVYDEINMKTALGSKKLVENGYPVLTEEYDLKKLLEDM